MELTVFLYNGILYGDKKNRPQLYAAAWVNFIMLDYVVRYKKVCFPFIENLKIGELIYGD